jgi:hypothetical protein
MTSTIDITPDWDDMRAFVRHLARTNLMAAHRITAEMGSEALEGGVLYAWQDAEDRAILPGDTVRHYVDDDTGTVLELTDPAAGNPASAEANHPGVLVAWCNEARPIKHNGDELTIIERELSHG